MPFHVVSISLVSSVIFTITNYSNTETLTRQRNFNLSEGGSGAHMNFHEKLGLEVIFRVPFC